MSIRHIAPWGISVALLVAAAAFFLFCMRGYTYIGCSLLFIAALVLIHHFGSEGFRRWTLILVSLGLIYFCLVELPIVKNARTDPEPGRKYLIVLGAAVHGDSPSLALTHRLEGALDYLNRYPDSVAIVSGGRGKGENITEAECMRRQLTAMGIGGSRLLLEERSTSTAENFAFSKELLRQAGIDPETAVVAVVTNDFHCFRAHLIAQREGLTVLDVPAEVPWLLLNANYYVREFFALGKTLIFD